MARYFEPVPTVALSDQTGATYVRLVELMQRLLAEDGCPWDRKQTRQTLKKYVLEEACEVIDAIEGGDEDDVCSELGDLLFQVVFQAEIGRAKGTFGPDDVVRGICDKLVRRHPHVFPREPGGPITDDVDWERIKAEERREAGADDALLGHIPRSLPALRRAQRVGVKVARVGFDWPSIEGSRDKVREEIGELDEAIAADDKAAMTEELGDALFALVNLARHLGVDAEDALRATTDKFTRRFGHVEASVKQRHGGWPPADSEPLMLDELDGYWEDAKRVERRG